MQVIELTRKTYPDGNRVDKEETFITNGYREPGPNRKTYEFRTPNGQKIVGLEDIVNLNIRNDGVGDPSKEIIKDYPQLNWTDWYDYTEDGDNLEAFLKTIPNFA